MKIRIVAAVVVLGSAFANSAATLDPMVPFMYQAGDPTRMVEAMKTLRRDFGLRRFVFTSPGLLRYFGRADQAEHERIGRGMAWAKEQVADTDIEIGWWDYPTFRGGLHEQGQHILDCDGNKSDALCPLDEHAHDAFLENLKTAAKIGRPAVYFVEDDFTLANHGGMNQMRGCFCPLHMEALSKRIGRSISAKELAGFFERPTKANESVRRMFAAVSRESLVQLARRIRKAADEVDPKVQIGLCQSGFVDQDGDTTEEIARALAGGTRPLVRVYGSRYMNENSPAELPCGTAHTFWSAQHLPKDFELIHESDPYPHTRFYNSSRFYISEICAAFMAGLSDSFLYCTRYSDDPIRDVGYARVFADYRRRLEVIKDFRLRSQVVGVRAVYDPAEAYLARVENGVVTFGSIEEIAYLLGKFGFPMTTLDSPVQVMIGATAKHLTDEQLKAALARGILIDADTALTLVERGFGEYLGCEVKEEPSLTFTYERTLPVDGVTRGSIDSCYHKRTLNAPIILSKSVRYARLTPRAGTETWARFEDIDHKEVSPSFTYAKNSLGGTVGVFAYSLKGNRRQYVLNPEKQELVEHFFRRASGGALDVSAPHTPCTWLTAAVSNDGREMLVMVNNLAGDPRDDVVLELSAKWKGAAVLRLAANGEWRPIGRAAGGFKLPFVCEPMVPEFVKLEIAE